MIKIYNSRTKVPARYRVLYDVEPLFDARVNDEISSIPRVTEIIKEVDDSILLEGDVIKTKFGVTNTMNLSTGCKVVLTYFWLKIKEETIPEFNLDQVKLSDIVLNLTECGPNSLKYLFNRIDYEENTLAFLLEHSLGAETFDSIIITLNDKCEEGFYA